MDLKHSENGYICRSIYNEQLQTQTVVYGNWILDSDTGETVGYLLLNARLVPVQSTVSILQRQTMIITIAMAFFGCVLSFLAATHIGVPITRLTRSAKRLAHGDYETKFEGGGCAEVDELAEALTYAEHELIPNRRNAAGFNCQRFSRYANPADNDESLCRDDTGFIWGQSGKAGKTFAGYY